MRKWRVQATFVNLVVDTAKQNEYSVLHGKNQNI